MGKWFGDLWPLRLVLLTAAGAVSLILLPWGATELQPVSAIGPVGPPLLLLNEHGQVRAWDWRTGKSWVIPPDVTPELVRPYQLGRYQEPVFAGIGDTVAMAVLQDGSRRIEMTDLSPPYKKTISPQFARASESANAPRIGSTLLAIDQTKKFALVWCKYLLFPKLESLEISTGRVVDSVDLEEHYVASDGDGVLARDFLEERKYRDLRYVVTDEGRFESRQIAEGVQGEVDFSFGPRMPPLVAPPPAAQVDMHTLELKSEDSEEKPIRISVPGVIVGFSRSCDGKELVTFDHQKSYEVWDITTGKRIAERSPQKRDALFRAVIVTIGLLVWPVSIVVAARESRLWWAMFDCFISTCIAMVWACEVSGLAGLAQAATGLAIAAGIYLATSYESLWKRVIFVVVVEFTLLIAFDGPIRWCYVSRKSPSMSDLHKISLETVSPVFGMVLPTLIAALGVWAFQRFGWQLRGQQDDAPKGRPFQFSLGALLFTTMLVALVVQLRQYQLTPDLSWQTIAARLGTLTLISVSLPVALSWLWLRDWSAWQWRVAAIVTFALVVASVLLLASDTVFRQNFSYAAKDFVIPWAIGLFSICLPLFVARRHGFRWVRATTPSE